MSCENQNAAETESSLIQQAIREAAMVTLNYGLQARCMSLLGGKEPTDTERAKFEAMEAGASAVYLRLLELFDHETFQWIKTGDESAKTLQDDSVERTEADG